MPESKYRIGKKQLDELEQEQAGTPIPMNPVPRDLGMDKHIGYKEISPSQASKSEVEKPLDEMTIEEIIERSKRKK